MEATFLEKADKNRRELESKLVEMETERQRAVMEQKSLEADVEKMEENFRAAIAPTQEKYKQEVRPSVRGRLPPPRMGCDGFARAHARAKRAVGASGAPPRRAPLPLYGKF